MLYVLYIVNKMVLNVSVLCRWQSASKKTGS